MPGPLRSRAYLDLVYLDGTVCAHCGRSRTPDLPIDPAHYCGKLADRLGRGAGQKVADLVAAPLCRICHAEFDGYVAGNDWERAALFLALCWAWLLANIARGHVELVVHTQAVQRDQRPSRERRRKKQRSTETPDKVFPRPPGGFSP